MTPPETQPHTDQPTQTPPTPLHAPGPGATSGPPEPSHGPGEGHVPPAPPHREPQERGTAFSTDPSSNGPSKVLVAGLVASGFAAGVAAGVAAAAVLVARKRSHRVRNRLIVGAAKRAPKAAIGTGRAAFGVGHAAGRTLSRARHAASR